MPLMLPHRSVGHMRQLAAVDTHARGWASCLHASACSMLSAPLLDVEREKGRDVILPTSRAVLERIQTLGVAWFLTGDHRFAQRGIEELVWACRMPDWNPAHFLDTAEMCHAVSVGLDWFGPLLNSEIRTEVAAAIESKALGPGAEQVRASAFWVGASHNWNLVCCSGLAIGCLALRKAGRKHEPLLAALLGHARRGFGSFSPDGSWDEGPAYWHYAASYAVWLLAALESECVTDGGLSGTPGFGETWRFHRDITGPGGTVFNFGDAAEAAFHAECVGWIGRRWKDPDALAWHRRQPGPIKPFDVVWLSPLPPAREAHAPGRRRDASVWRAGVGTLRAENAFVGLKGGRNDTNHAHRDLGSFVLEWGGQRFGIDPGPGDYAQDGYFDPARRGGFAHVLARSHSTLLPDGRDQSDEATGRLERLPDAGAGQGLACHVDDGVTGFAFTRSVRLTDAGECSVEDVVRSTPAPRLAWRLQTRADVALTGDGAVLRLGDRGLRLTVKAGPDMTLTVEECAAQADGLPAIRTVVARSTGLPDGGPASIRAIFEPLGS